MTSCSLRLLLLLSGLLAASRVDAQATLPDAAAAPEPAAPATSAEGEEEDSSAEPPGDDAKVPVESSDSAGASLEGYAPPSQVVPANGESAAEAEQGSADEAWTPAAPPGPPAAEEQRLAPVPAEPAPSVSRRVLLGVYGGAVHRTSEEERITYETSFAFGPLAAVDVLPWLMATAYARFESISVRTATTAFDAEGSQFSDAAPRQAPLDSVGLGFRVAPNLALTDQVKVLSFVEVAWNRFTAPEPITRGQEQVRSAERAGVGLNYKGGIGISVEPIRHWLQASLIGSYGIFTNQNGSAFDVLQGFDEAGKIVHLAPLPRFRRSLELVAAAGVLF